MLRVLYFQFIVMKRIGCDVLYFALPLFMKTLRTLCRWIVLYSHLLVTPYEHSLHQPLMTISLDQNHRHDITTGYLHITTRGKVHPSYGCWLAESPVGDILFYYYSLCSHFYNTIPNVDMVTSHVSVSLNHAERYKDRKYVFVVNK